MIQFFFCIATCPWNYVNVYFRELGFTGQQVGYLSVGGTVLAAVLLLVSLGFFIPVLVEYTQTALVPRIPTLIVCGFTAIAGALSFFAGLELESARKKDRQDFELALHRASDRRKDLMERESE